MTFLKWAMLLGAPLMVAGCQHKGFAGDPCTVLREPPAMQSGTRQAVFNDKAFSTWVILVDKDGKSFGCWQ